MKKLIAIILVIGTALSLCGCVGELLGFDYYDYGDDGGYNQGGGTGTTNDSGIEPDTWYYATNLDILVFQNAKVSNAFIAGGGSYVNATYYPVCKKCHTVSTSLEWVAVYPDEPINDLYYCDSCGASTTCRLKIYN